MVFIIYGSCFEVTGDGIKGLAQVGLGHGPGGAVFGRPMVAGEMHGFEHPVKENGVGGVVGVNGGAFGAVVPVVELRGDDDVFEEAEGQVEVAVDEDGLECG
jgi:2',3'-cyclic-nucleotide 2'-phosphodiesterase (5'-nucleotidase family)